MADTQDLLYQNSSIDYLSQINRNVIALNTTATIQKDIFERQSAVTNASQDLVQQAQDSNAAKIQQQAYMAYGTFQHDIKNMQGFTDQGTRTALATMQIAGGMAVTDVRNVQSSAANAGANAALSLYNINRPGYVKTQGILGDIIGATGITRGPTEMYASEYQEMSSRGIGRFGSNLANQFLGTGVVGALLDPSRAERSEREERLNYFAPRINPSGVDANGNYVGRNRFMLTNEQMAKGGQAIKESELYLRDLGYKNEEASNIVNTGAQVEFQTGRKMSIEDLSESIKQFTKDVKALENSFGAQGSKIADAIGQLRLQTGSNQKDTRSLMEDLNQRANALGMNGEEKLNALKYVGATAGITNTSAAVAEQMYMEAFTNVRETANRSPAYKEFTSRMGGEDKVALQNIQNAQQFKLSNMGFMATAANASGGSMAGGMANFAVAAAKTFAKGPGQIYQTMYDQIFEKDSFGKNEQRDEYLNLFRMMPEFSDVKTNELMPTSADSLNPTQQKFLGFLSSILGTRDKNTLLGEYFRLFGKEYNLSKGAVQKGIAYNANQMKSTEKLGIASAMSAGWETGGLLGVAKAVMSGGETASLTVNGGVSATTPAVAATPAQTQTTTQSGIDPTAKYIGERMDKLSDTLRHATDVYNAKP